MPVAFTKKKVRERGANMPGKNPEYESKLLGFLGEGEINRKIYTSFGSQQTLASLYN